MLGLMQDWPLLCHRIIDHAALQHGERRVITRSLEGPFHTTNYAEIRARALRVAQRLDRDGIKLGDRVATLAWNTWRHLEAWYGITGIGAVYHTVNPRLFPDQIAWIVNHAEDRMMIIDVTFVADAGENRRQDADHRALRAAVRRRAHAEDDAAQRRALRGMDRRGRRRFRLEAARRKDRGRHVLHLRHHRQSQGRRLFAPLQRATSIRHPFTIVPVRGRVARIWPVPASGAASSAAFTSGEAFAMSNGRPGTSPIRAIRSRIG